MGLVLQGLLGHCLQAFPRWISTESSTAKGRRASPLTTAGRRIPPSLLADVLRAVSQHHSIYWIVSHAPATIPPPNPSFGTCAAGLIDLTRGNDGIDTAPDERARG